MGGFVGGVKGDVLTKTGPVDSAYRWQAPQVGGIAEITNGVEPPTEETPGVIYIQTKE